MQITDDSLCTVLSVERKAGSAYVRLSDETVLQIPPEICRALRLKKGMSVRKDSLTERIGKASYPSACNRAASLLSVRNRSVREISSALSRSGYNPETIEKTIGYLETLDYLNDEAFSRDWIRARSAKGIGANRIRAELVQKGVSRDIIQDQMEAVNESGPGSSGALQKCLAKAVRGRDLSDAGEKRKVIQYALRRGFSYQEIKSGLDDIIREQDLS